MKLRDQNWWILWYFHLINQQPQCLECWVDYSGINIIQSRGMCNHIENAGWDIGYTSERIGKLGNVDLKYDIL